MEVVSGAFDVVRPGVRQIAMGCGQSLQRTPEVVTTEPCAPLIEARPFDTTEHSAKDNATYGTEVGSKKDEVQTIRGSA